jgi:cell division septation protein DedD
MEYFDQTPHKGIKEKNMYVLHLDTPRVIILCSVIVGIIVISFLLGMNLTKPGDPQKDAAGDFSISENGLAPTGDDGLPPPETELAKNPSLPHDEKGAEPPAKLNDHPAIGAKNAPPADIITSENLKDIAPPTAEVKKATASDEDPKINKRNEPRKTKRSKKQKVVEVSSGEKGLKDADAVKNHYSIQIAAFDTRSKAQHEISALKKLSYDAYMDRTQVNGRNFFRVRIGPIASKKKAIDMLNELQENDRYDESFLIRE